MSFVDKIKDVTYVNSPEQFPKEEVMKYLVRR